jgi:hypothetical protein
LDAVGIMYSTFRSRSTTVSGMLAPAPRRAKLNSLSLARARAASAKRNATLCAARSTALGSASRLAARVVQVSVEGREKAYRTRVQCHQRSSGYRHTHLLFEQCPFPQGPRTKGPMPSPLYHRHLYACNKLNSRKRAPHNMSVPSALTDPRTPRSSLCGRDRRTFDMIYYVNQDSSYLLM